MAVRHLLEVSVCLLGVCLILCLAASMTHSLVRRYHWNGLDLQNVTVFSYVAISLVSFVFVLKRAEKTVLIQLHCFTLFAGALD